MRQRTPFRERSSGDRISGDQLALPAQVLVREEADAFLKWLFLAVGRRPKRLDLREGARVARYLGGLAWETPPGPLRRQIDRMAEVIWRTIWTNATFDAAGKGEVLTFLDKHAKTYLLSFDVAAVRKQVLQCDRPSPTALGGHPPLLRSSSVTVVGEGSSQLADDLSERIYAAYHGIRRRAGIRGARKRVADALNATGRMVAVHLGAGTIWDSQTVYARVKQYEKSMSRRFDDALAARAWSDWVVNKWISAFRSQIGEKRTPSANSGTNVK